MVRTTQNLYSDGYDSPYRFSGKGEERNITYIDPLRRIEDALKLDYLMEGYLEGIA